MVAKLDIQAAVDFIAREFSPRRIILFGSYASGTPNEDSDVDLFVELPGSEAELRKAGLEIYRRCPRQFAMDLIVRSPEEIASRMANNDWFLHDVLEKGRTVYESAHVGVGRES